MGRREDKVLRHLKMDGNNSGINDRTNCTLNSLPAIIIWRNMDSTHMPLIQQGLSEVRNVEGRRIRKSTRTVTAIDRRSCTEA
jgi:hypothetical protein